MPPAAAASQRRVTGLLGFVPCCLWIRALSAETLARRRRGPGGPAASEGGARAGSPGGASTSTPPLAVLSSQPPCSCGGSETRSEPSGPTEAAALAEHSP
uniref:Uncharacterized protein n=1 Tax=Alexandrium monilatum TaxID=311494 RepID=A0A7S4R8U6_9DINO